MLRLHGIIHAFGGLFFFISGPIGTILVARKFSRAGFLITLVAVVIGVILLTAPINAGGLAERIILFGIFSSVIVDSFGTTKI